MKKLLIYLLLVGSVYASGDVSFPGLVLSSPGDLQRVEGPAPDIAGFTSATPVVLTGHLAPALPGRGSLSFWFRTDQTYRSGVGAQRARVPLVDFPGAFRLFFESDTDMVTIFVEWHDPAKELAGRHIRIQLPELPGPAWHHFALQWDGAVGDVNAWVDGTPFYVPGEKVPPFRLGEATVANIHFDRFALADVRFSPEVTAGDEAARSRLPRTDSLAHLLGAAPLAPLSTLSLDSPIYQTPLSEAEDIVGWKMEGPGIASFSDGWMELRSQRPDGPEGHLVLWCPQDFPADFQAEWDFQVVNPKGLSIVFFAATGTRGRDLFDPALEQRDGIFQRYINGQISSYHISYFSNAPDVPRAVANLRKNPGFYLIANGPAGVPRVQPSGTVHRATLRKDGGRIQMAVDGRTVIGYTDDGQRAGPILGTGKIGFRQMQWTVFRYRNFRVFKLP